MKNKKYVEFKKLGLCVRCGKKPLIGKTRCETCHAKHLEYQKTAKQKALDAGLCRTCLINILDNNSQQCLKCKSKNNKRGKENYQKVKSECIQSYGEKCVCCGETNIKYLQLDHINNDGGKHRNEIGAGINVLKWAKKNSFPKSLQLLCANCHQAKTIYGGCTLDDHEKN